MTNTNRLRRSKKLLSRILMAREITCNGTGTDRSTLIQVYQSPASVEVHDDGKTGRMLVHGSGEVFAWRWEAPTFASLEEAQAWLRRWEDAETFEEREADRVYIASRASKVADDARAELLIFKSAVSDYALAAPCWRLTDWHVV